MIRKKRNRKAHTPGFQIAMNEFAYVFSLYALPTYIRSSFYGDKHQKLPRKLNTCAFFYLFIFLIFTSPPTHVPTHTFYVLHTLNNIREIRCFPLFSFFDCYIPTLIGVMYYSVKVICKCVTDTNWKISLCKWHIRSTPSQGVGIACSFVHTYFVWNSHRKYHTTI